MDADKQFYAKRATSDTKTNKESVEVDKDRLQMSKKRSNIT